MKYLKTIVLLSILTIFLSSCSSTFSHSKLAFLGTNLATFSSGTEMKNYISFSSLGEGNYTVVLENDLGEEMDSWDEVFELIAQNSKVLAYNRPGYSDSTPTSSPRTPLQIANDLRKLLIISNNHPPYILVGHGLGGNYMLTYAEQYPQEVAGIVLIETPHPDFLGLCDEAGIKGCDPVAAIVDKIPNHVRIEYKESKEIFLPEDISDIPLVVVSKTPTIALSKSKKYRTLWIQTQRDLTSMSTNSQHIIATHAGKYVQHDEPDTIIKAIDWIKSQTKKITKEEELL